MCIIFILIIAQFWTEMFDIVLQMNVSCSCTMPIMTEYLVDQEKYFYFILSWTNVIICIQLIVTLAIGITFLTFIQHIHICGMFKIAKTEILIFGMYIQDSLINLRTYIRNICYIQVHIQYLWLWYIYIAVPYICDMIYLYCSYRIEHALDMDTLKSNMKSVNLICRKIICADIQRQAMKLVFL